MKYALTITPDGLTGDLARLFERFEPTDLPRIELAYRGLSGLHAVLSQLFAPKTAPPAAAAAKSAPTQPGEPTDLERLVATLTSEERLKELATDPVVLDKVRAHFPEYFQPNAVSEPSTNGKLHGPLGTDDFHEQVATVEDAAISTGACTELVSERTDGRTAILDAHRLAIARFLAAHGPQSSGEIARVCDVSSDSVSRICTHEWFAKQGEGPATKRALTDAGREALREMGYVVAPVAEVEPSEPEETSPPQPIPPSRDAATGISSNAERAKLQCLVMAEALAESSVPLTVHALSNAAGVPEDKVLKRLKYWGPAAVQNGVLRYFHRDGDLWSLTDAGKVLAAGGKAVTT